MTELIEIQINSVSSNFRASTNINDINLNFDFFFNNRMNRWILSIYDENSSPIITGLNVVNNQDILLNKKHLIPELSNISLFFTHTDQYNSLPASRDTLGNTVIFLYSQEI